MAPDGRRQEGQGRWLDKLKSIGYVGSPASRAQRVNPDWTTSTRSHYNADLDQIL